MHVIDYIKLTAPRINLLVLVTAFIGIRVASRGEADTSLIIFTLVGVSLASAGASVFNNYYDRDIDRLMGRTLNRPLPSGVVEPSNVLFWGYLLSAASFLVLIIFVNSITAVLAMLSIVVYSYVYTILLKRKTPLATEIGGIAGALPPVIGWTAVQGRIGIEAMVLFSIILLWQPPHFWSLASRYIEDYKKAGIPAMPVARPGKETILRSMIYIISLVVTTFFPYITGIAGYFYLFIALSLGLVYSLLYAMSLISDKDMSRYLFFYSILYLTSIYGFIAIDMNI